jgi:CheY-like chemotaxis protein
MAPHLLYRGSMKLDSEGKASVAPPGQLRENQLKPSILVIDDDQGFCSVLHSVLSRGGYEVTAVSDGHLALKLYEQNKYDLILSDLIMPDLDGVGLIMALRKMNPDATILAMSGGGVVPADTYLRLASAFRVNAVLRKPFAMSHLLEVVKQELSRSPVRALGEPTDLTQSRDSSH